MKLASEGNFIPTLSMVFFILVPCKAQILGDVFSLRLEIKVIEDVVSYVVSPLIFFQH